MQPDDTGLARAQQLGREIPWSTDEACRMLYRLAVAMKSKQIVEVSTGYGKSTLYLAAAARENRATLRSVDRLERRWRRRSPSDLLMQAGLASRCRLTTDIDARWYLIELFSARPGCWVDLAFLDASHVIETDSFLALSLWTHLRPGGVLVMDDLDWNAAEHGKVTRASSRPDTKHIRTLFEYLRRLPDVVCAVEWGTREISWSYGMLQKAPRGRLSFDLKAFLRGPSMKRRPAE